MKICFNTHQSNSEKPELIPSGYPFIVYETENDFQCPDGFQELSVEDFEAYKSSFDLTDYNNSLIFVPQSVTPKQLRLALFSKGITSQNIIDTINTFNSPEKEKALIEWEFSTQFERSNPLVNSIGVQLGYNSQQLDQLFIDASKI